MYQSVWSIDVGKSSLKAVKMQRERNHLEIVSVDKIDYSVEPGGIDVLTQSKDAIAELVSRNTISGPVIVSHPGHSAFSRFIQLPPVDAKKLDEMIGYEAQQQIPFPIDEVIWDYHVCDDDSAGAEKEVGIFAVRSEVISDFMIDYEGSGIPLSMISVGYLGLLNYVLFDLRPKKPCVVLDIGAEHTDLLVVDGKRFWIRNLGIAGNDITQALQDKFKLQFVEAEKLKKSASKSDQAAKIFGVIQPNLKELVNEIHRSVGFYKSQAGDVKFEEIYLVGNGAKVLGLSKFLSDQLRFKVQVAKGFHRIRVNREANVAMLQSEFPSFASVVGNAIQALGEGECNVNLMPKEQQEALEFQKKQKFVIASAASLFILVFFLMSVYGARIESAKEAYLKTKLAGEYQDRADEIENLQKSSAKVSVSAGALSEGARNRIHPYAAIEAAHQVFGGLGGDNAIIKTIGFVNKVDEIANVKNLVDTEVNPKKFWLVQYEVERAWVDHTGATLTPKDVKAGRRGGGIENAIPAYRVKVTGMCEKRGTPTASKKDVDKNVVLPLEEKVKELLGDPPGDAGGNWIAMTIGQGDDRLFETHSEFKKGRPVDEIQGVYFNFTLEWTQFSGDLPEPPKEPKKKKK